MKKLAEKILEVMKEYTYEEKEKAIRNLIIKVSILKE